MQPLLSAESQRGPQSSAGNFRAEAVHQVGGQAVNVAGGRHLARLAGQSQLRQGQFIGRGEKRRPKQNAWNESSGRSSEFRRAAVDGALQSAE